MQKQNQQYLSSGTLFVRKMVMVSDFIIALLVLLLFLISSSSFVPRFFVEQPIVVMSVATMSMLVAQSVASTIIHRRRVSLNDVLQRTTLLTVVYCGCLFLLLRATAHNPGGYFRFFFIYFFTFYVCVLASRFIELHVLRKYRAQGKNTRLILYVGNNPAIVKMYKDIMLTPSSGYRVKGYYADNDLEGAPQGLERLGTMADFEKIVTTPATGDDVKESRIADVIFYASVSQIPTEQQMEAVLRYCDANISQFVYVPPVSVPERFHLYSESFLGHLVFVNRLEPLARLGNRIAKRTFDIVMSGIICLCLLPLLPIVALIIRIQSPGPLFFRQERTGIHGETFRIFKFRSMHVNAASDTLQATKDDPRKFAFGNFMRKTNIDELPQFFNVLIGDMSIVGPRPHMLYHTETYSRLISQYMVRHFSKPGITGWAQVTGFRGETQELWQMEERVKRDIWYNENWTFWLDIKIIFMTAKSIIIPDKNAY